MAGFARMLHERRRIRFGWLTPMLATFVAIDIATFWNQAWVIFRGAPYNFTLLLVGLAVAAVFYVAASVTFPRIAADGGEERIDLDEHFWAQRGLVFGCILLANLIVVALFTALAMADAGFAAMARSPALWGGLLVFVAGSATAAFAPQRRVAIAAMVVVLAYTLWNVARAAWSLVLSGGWSPAMGA